MNLLKYSNGWGHLIMSLAFLGTGVYLYIKGDTVIALSLITTVSAAWFIPGAAHQVASQMQQQVVEQAAPKIAAEAAPKIAEQAAPQVVQQITANLPTVKPGGKP